MATFSCKTKGNADPKGKPRVYFCCHPEDFDRYFDKVREDIFKTHDCAIYYTADMTEAFDEHDMDTDLGQMNLFVVPVTYRLLSQPNRAMDVDLAYAKRQNIAILPFMMESGIDAFYSAPEKFGQRQYISPYSTDATEISYEDKLKKYLEAVLISDETAQRVRDAFDAYIFLSYRKKDRRYANQLMRLIHKNPEYRDIAIWYDEFLTPGESFKQNIDKAMQQSKLFALLVTPNLLEYVDGKPNFVMGVEYPAAKSAGMGVLPAEMVETDKAELREKYADIPDCVSVEDEPALRQRLLDALDKIAKSENNNDPEHNFLIGLAYLDGIDVEVDRNRALELITSAAEADLPEAMEKLRDMYEKGVGVDLDYRKAVKWAEKSVAYYERHYGKGHEYTTTSLNRLSIIYFKSGNFSKSREIAEQAYELLAETLGELHPTTLYSLSLLACSYNELGDRTKAFQLNESVYKFQCEVMGEYHPQTLSALTNLAFSYNGLGDYPKALNLHEKVFSLYCDKFGEQHPDTLKSLSNLSFAQYEYGNYETAYSYSKLAYELQSNILGQKHPDTIASLCVLSNSLQKLGEYKEAFKLGKQAHLLYCDVLGGLHPTTINSLGYLADLYYSLGNTAKAIELMNKTLSLLGFIRGEQHPITRTTLSTLASFYEKIGDCKTASQLNALIFAQNKKYDSNKEQSRKSLSEKLALAYYALNEIQKDSILEEIELEKSIYWANVEEFEENDANLLDSLSYLSDLYREIGDFHTVLEMREQLYSLRTQALGNTHPDTIAALSKLASSYSDVCNYQKALELYQKVYSIQLETLGEKHLDTATTMINLAQLFEILCEHEKATEFEKTAYYTQCALLGEAHSDTLSTLYNLAWSQNLLENYHESLLLYDKVYSRYKITLGKKHPKTLGVLYTLAEIHDRFGNKQQSIELHQKCYDLRCKVLGKDHPDTIQSKKNLSIVQGNAKQAKKKKGIGGLFKKLFG